jgi:hypothetical protein
MAAARLGEALDQRLDLRVEEHEAHGAAALLELADRRAEAGQPGALFASSATAMRAPGFARWSTAGTTSATGRLPIVS